MPDEKPVEEVFTYYDEIRADVETAVYAYTSFEEMDLQLHSQIMQRNIKNAKRDCIKIMCKGLQLIREGYEEKEDEEE
jgi:hypothetical protein